MNNPLKLFSWLIVCIYIVIFTGWLMNSPILFSLWGVIGWLMVTAAGWWIQKLIYGSSLTVKILLLLNYFMIFLIGLTVFIYVATSSMP
ncbi:hypothetical protein CEY16_13300 [Halalkalibacillus sediminis]|uniref:Uncharacterized protein n=1 Tax=Halalkalibacillus sediminis TaxID=2018042 RepID=A0A2I0QRT8_9BACI|nr:hypothetical protein CEY16_13300 [Halalkalibacillus sediminis]